MSASRVADVSPRAEVARAGHEAPRVLIVDDEQSMREWMRILFQRDGFDVLLAENGVAARDLLGREYVDVVLTDIRMPRMDGLELLKCAREIAPDAIVMMMTAHFTRDSDDWRHAREAGASALLEKPFRDINIVTLQVRQLIDARRVRHERDVLRHAISEQGFAGIVGRSAPMLDVFRMVETVCRTNSTVLITGESGTGKELVARAIHSQSLRRDQPFVAVNCGALPETLLESELFGHVRGAFTGAETNKKGLIEAADKGTVFLDEIAEMTPAMQVKLLRVLQERKYRRVGGTEETGANIRVIAATNCDLTRVVADGKFREDLFYRLNVIPIRLPALRDRADDVPLIAGQLLAKHAREMGKATSGFAPEALDALKAYPWPGNVRELENVVERAVALEHTDRISIESLPQELRDGRPATAVGGSGRSPEMIPPQGFNLERHLEEIERNHLERALRQTDGVQTRAAELLGLSFRQFRYLAKKYDIRANGTA
ncbi:MAG TPA: sigma-54 dependent transcriptional regulator [Vicinamibacterales bacterium]|nr:sigma-54 dependent transcriptional regulator [Vicinamibacterales bacterium]